MSKLIEEYEGYLIKQTRRKFIVVSMADREKHSHMNSIKDCKNLIDIIIKEGVPRTKYWIMAILRLLEECEYKERLMDCYENFEPKQKYVREGVPTKLRNKRRTIAV